MARGPNFPRVVRPHVTPVPLPKLPQANFAAALATPTTAKKTIGNGGSAMVVASTPSTGGRGSVAADADGLDDRRKKSDKKKRRKRKLQEMAGQVEDEHDVASSSPVANTILWPLEKPLPDVPVLYSSQGKDSAASIAPIAPIAPIGDPTVQDGSAGEVSKKKKTKKRTKSMAEVDRSPGAGTTLGSAVFTSPPPRQDTSGIASTPDVQESSRKRRRWAAAQEGDGTPNGATIHTPGPVDISMPCRRPTAARTPGSQFSIPAPPPTIPRGYKHSVAATRTLPSDPPRYVDESSDAESEVPVQAFSRSSKLAGTPRTLSVQPQQSQESELSPSPDKGGEGGETPEPAVTSANGRRTRTKDPRQSPSPESSSVPGREAAPSPDQTSSQRPKSSYELPLPSLRNISVRQLHHNMPSVGEPSSPTGTPSVARSSPGHAVAGAAAATASAATPRRRSLRSKPNVQANGPQANRSRPASTTSASPTPRNRRRRSGMPTTLPEAQQSLVLTLIEDYGARNAFSTEEVKSLLFRKRGEGATTMSNKHARTLWKQIYEACPDDENKYLRRKVQRFLGVAADTPWSRDDDVMLAGLVDGLGHKWSDIGEVMGRNPDNCRDRYRNHAACGDNKVLGRWTEEQVSELIRCVRVVVLGGDYRDHGDGPTTMEHDAYVDWFRVSQHMDGRRSRQQCMKKWEQLKLYLVHDEVRALLHGELPRVDTRVTMARMVHANMSADECLDIVRAIAEHEIADAIGADNDDDVVVGGGGGEEAVVHVGWEALRQGETVRARGGPGPLAHFWWGVRRSLNPKFLMMDDRSLARMLLKYVEKGKQIPSRAKLVLPQDEEDEARVVLGAARATLRMRRDRKGGHDSQEDESDEEEDDEEGEDDESDDASDEVEDVGAGGAGDGSDDEDEDEEGDDGTNDQNESDAEPAETTEFSDEDSLDS